VATNAKWLAACDKGNRRGSVGGHGFTILVTIEIAAGGPLWLDRSAAVMASSVVPPFRGHVARCNSLNRERP